MADDASEKGRRRPSKAVMVMKAIDCLNAIKTVGKDKMALLFEDLDNSDISKMVPVLVKMAGKTDIAKTKGVLVNGKVQPHYKAPATSVLVDAYMTQAVMEVRAIEDKDEAMVTLMASVPPVSELDAIFEASTFNTQVARAQRYNSKINELEKAGNFLKLYACYLRGLLYKFQRVC